MSFTGFYSVILKSKYVPKITVDLLLSCVYFGEIEVNTEFCHPKIIHFKGCEILAWLFVLKNKPLLKN